VHLLELWLACFIFWSLLAWEYQCENTTWIQITSSLLGVACFLDQSFWLLQLSISNVHRITTSILAFQVPHLVYAHIGRQAPTVWRSDLSPKNHSWYSLELTWLIDPSDRLNLMSNLEFFFNFFSFYLFKSFSFYQMISNCY
jgi:hypothetical protein